MRRGASILIFLLACSAFARVFGQADLWYQSQSAAVTSQGGGGGITLPYQEQFNSGTAPERWTASGSSINWTATPLEGTFSVGITNNSDSITLDPLPITTTDTYSFFEFSVSATAGANTAIFQLYDSNGTLLSRLLADTFGKLRLYQGASFDSTSSYSTGGQTNYVWHRYTQGTGANSIVYLWITNAPVKPASYTARVTGGANTTPGSYFLFQGFGGNGVRIDNLEISTNDITTVP